MTKRKRGPRPRPIIERVWEKIDVHGPDECWPFTGSKVSPGYGVIYDNSGERRAKRQADRLVYEDKVGPIPEGMFLDHTCENPACCNPAHLEPIPRAWKGMTCKHGHALAYKRDGDRMLRFCPTCVEIQTRIAHWAQPGR